MTILEADKPKVNAPADWGLGERSVSVSLVGTFPVSSYSGRGKLTLWGLLTPFLRG